MSNSKEGEGQGMIGTFKTISDNSQALITWSLSIIGGSIAAIVGSSYLRPDSIWMRLPYLFFVPGWIFLIFSIYKGHEVSRRHIASMFTKNNESLIEIGQAINTAYKKQLVYFGRSLVLFAVWLLFFLVWWVIKGPSSAK